MKVGNITDEIKQQIIDENHLREVAAEYGVEFNSNGKAKCPFHREGRNGNLHLFDKKDEQPTYYCFKESCNAGKIWNDKKKTDRHTLTLPDGEKIEDGGPNVIGFVMNIERVSYIEACVILMNRAGIPIPEARRNPKLERKKKKVHNLNIKYCQTLLNEPKMLDYLEERGIQQESIKKWRLGYIKQNDTGNPCFGDKVSGRLVFGLKEDSYDNNAKTVAMAYRSMDGTMPKYYNDPTSDLYEKKSYLYGITEARKAIRKEKFVFVMEGYTDVILAHQAGIENAIATCGTSFTEEQIEKLRRLTNKIVFWFDGDMAGIDAMLSQVEELVERGFRVQCVVANGQDPAEWINELGQDYEAIMEFIKEHKRPALQMIADQSLRRYEAGVQTLRNDVLDELLPVLESIQDPVEKINFRSQVENRLGVRI